MDDKLHINMIADWELLKSKFEQVAKDARKGQIGAKDEANADFLQGTLLAMEGALHLMRQIEEVHDTPDTEEKEDEHNTRTD